MGIARAPETDTASSVGDAEGDGGVRSVADGDTDGGVTEGYGGRRLMRAVWPSVSDTTPVTSVACRRDTWDWDRADDLMTCLRFRARPMRARR